MPSSNRSKVKSCNVLLISSHPQRCFPKRTARLVRVHEVASENACVHACMRVSPLGLITLGLGRTAKRCVFAALRWLCQACQPILSPLLRFLPLLVDSLPRSSQAKRHAHPASCCCAMFVRRRLTCSSASEGVGWSGGRVGLVGGKASQPVYRLEVSCFCTLLLHTTFLLRRVVVQSLSTFHLDLFS